MKTKIFIGLLLPLTFCFGEVKISGFGQVRYDSSNSFSIPKARVFLKGPVESGIAGLNVRYEVFADFGVNGLPQLGFASLILKIPKNWSPELIIGRTLDALSYQFPGPHQIPVLNYPAASFNTSCGTGIYLREIYGKWWVMTGLINGTTGYKDDNKSLDFTGRVAYNLPFGFTISSVFQSGNQPAGYRQIHGGDLAWRWRSIWINGGQNIYEFNGCQTARWLWSTLDVTKVVQLVGLVESLEKDGQTLSGWTAGVNFNLTPQTVVRLDYFRSARSKSLRGWGVLFQQIF